METIDVSQSPDPVLSLILEKLKPILKTWLHAELAGAKPVDQTPVFYSRKETCQILRISIPTLNRYVTRGTIKSNRVGNRVLFSQESISEALQKKQRDV